MRIKLNLKKHKRRLQHVHCLQKRTLALLQCSNSFRLLLIKRQKLNLMNLSFLSNLSRINSCGRLLLIASQIPRGDWRFRHHLFFSRTFCYGSRLMRTCSPWGMGKKERAEPMCFFLRQANVDESLMHSKGIVDLALFSSGMHILTLKVLLLSSEKYGSCGRIKKGVKNAPSLQTCVPLKTHASHQRMIW